MKEKTRRYGVVRILKNLDVNLRDAYGARWCQLTRANGTSRCRFGHVCKVSLPMPSKSIFRQPGAQHFQLVHRSQRDPLINDPDASQHVLKPVVRENAKKVIHLQNVPLFQLVTPSTRASPEQIWRNLFLHQISCLRLDDLKSVKPPSTGSTLMIQSMTTCNIYDLWEGKRMASNLF